MSNITAALYVVYLKCPSIHDSWKLIRLNFADDVLAIRTTVFMKQSAGSDHTSSVHSSHHLKPYEISDVVRDVWAESFASHVGSYRSKFDNFVGYILIHPECSNIAEVYFSKGERYVPSRTRIIYWHILLNAIFVHGDLPKHTE